MMGSAQQQFEVLLEDEVAGQPEAAAAGPSVLRQQVSERLRSHRERRVRGAQVGEMAEAAKAAGSPERRALAAAVAATVAGRYAQTQSYRAFLAQEAERAIQQAAAAAEIAQRNAAAVTAVQQELLAELKLWDAPQKFSAETAVVAGPAVVSSPKPAAAPTSVPMPGPVKQVSTGGITVRLYEDMGPVVREVARPSAAPARGAAAVLDAEEARALDEEIAFRQAPVFEDHRAYREPATPLPANLLEFPRQLVAARKARPRLAEGPLLEGSGPRSPQLRIFEVEPEQISTEPETFSMVPEWSSIRLDAHTVTEVVENPDMPMPEILPSLLPPASAPMQLRAMAALVDLTLVAGGLVVFAAGFAMTAGTVPIGVPAAVIGGVALVVLYVLYQLLFFTLSDQTPGMRYARIGLCTFTDENPTRAAMRKRLLAQAIAVCPLGLGVLWALLDDDRLGWHDRISRMYQRAY